MARGCRPRITPAQLRLMLPTNRAPTSTTAIGPAAVSKTQTTLSLRAKSPGTLAAVGGIDAEQVARHMTREPQRAG